MIIVAHNGRRYLAEHLPSLIQSVGAGAEIILVDNHSGDGTAGWIRSAFPEVRVVSSRANLGYGGGGNLGARSASGETLIFLNQDVRVSEGWLRPLVQPLEIDPGIGLTTPLIMLHEKPTVINTAGNEMHLTGLTLCRTLRMGSVEPAGPEDVTAVSGAAFAIRRELFQYLGGFDQGFFMYCEDSDLSLRARLAGYRCQFVPDSVVYHDYQLQFGTGKLFLLERNRYLMLLKVFRWRTLLLLLPALLLGELVSWGFVLLRKRESCREKVQAYAYLLGHWRATMEARQKTQMLRKAADKELLGAMSWQLAFEQASAARLASAAHLIFDPPFFGAAWIVKKLVVW